MAVMTEGEIRHLIDSYIVDNQAHGISPAKMRDMMQQMVTYVTETAGGGGGGSMAIGSPVDGGTPGDILLVDIDGNLGQTEYPNVPVIGISINLLNQDANCTITHTPTEDGLFLICPKLHFNLVAGVGVFYVTCQFVDENGDNQELTFYKQGSTAINVAAPGPVAIPPMTVFAKAGTALYVFFHCPGFGFDFNPGASIIKI